MKHLNYYIISIYLLAWVTTSMFVYCFNIFLVFTWKSNTINLKPNHQVSDE